METSKVAALRYWLEWTKTFLMLVGAVTVVGFFRVNVLGQSIQIQLPEYYPAAVSEIISQFEQAEQYRVPEQVAKKARR